MLNSGIYAIVSPSGKVYIGSSRRLKFRKARHFSDLRNGRHENSALQRAWVKYDGQLTFQVVEYCSENILIEREQHWMDKAHTIWEGSYNQRSIAGKIGSLDESTKEKLRVAMTGLFHSEETKNKMRKPKTPEHAAAISAGKKGKARKGYSVDQRNQKSRELSDQWASGKRDRGMQRERMNRDWLDSGKRIRRLESMRQSWTPERRARAADRLKEKHLVEHMSRLDWIVGGIWVNRFSEAHTGTHEAAEA